MMSAIVLLACAVCASADPTLQAPGFEQPFAQRFRLGVDALAGQVAEAAPDGRRLTVDDLRVSATATYAPTRDVLLSLTVPALERSLHDASATSSTFLPGDVDARVYGVATRGVDTTRRQLGFFGGLKGPTAPTERDRLGVALPVDLEPGCGSLVPYVGAAYAIGRGHTSAQASASIYLPFSVRHQPHPGDSLRTSAWLQIQETPALATRFGVSTRLDSTGELRPAVADLNSGGFVGYVTTDVLVSPATDVVVALGAMFPAVQAWFGVHRESSIAALRVAYDSSALSPARRLRLRSPSLPRDVVISKADRAVPAATFRASLRRLDAAADAGTLYVAAITPWEALRAMEPT